MNRCEYLPKFRRQICILLHKLPVGGTGLLVSCRLVRRVRGRRGRWCRAAGAKRPSAGHGPRVAVGGKEQACSCLTAGARRPSAGHGPRDTPERTQQACSCLTAGAGRPSAGHGPRTTPERPKRYFASPDTAAGKAYRSNIIRIIFDANSASKGSSDDSKVVIKFVYVR